MTRVEVLARVDGARPRVDTPAFTGGALAWCAVKELMRKQGAKAFCNKNKRRKLGLRAVPPKPARARVSGVYALSAFAAAGAAGDTSALQTGGHF